MIGSTMRMRSALLCAALLTAMVGIGCSDDEEINPQLAYRQALLADSFKHQFSRPPETSDEDCTTILTPATDPQGDAAMIKKAVLDAVSWDVICLAPGAYSMGMNGANPVLATISVSNVSNLTIKGIGDEKEDTTLDFAGQLDDRGFDVTVPGFWIENMWLKNTAENGVEVKATNAENNPNVFRKLRVSWDAGSVTANGAYSIYPTKSTYIIAEFSEVEGASDAGLYIGQVEHGIVRYNYVHGNVAGLEVENSYDVEVIGNAVTDNTGGILALQEPNLSRLSNDSVLILYNDVYENNRANFASGGAVANVPPGTGLMSFSGTNVEFRDNTVTENRTAGLLIVSNVILEALDGGAAPFLFPDGYDPYPTNIYQHGNVYTDNGTNPDTLILLAFGGPVPLPPVLWDGYISDGIESEWIVGPGVTEPVPNVVDPGMCFGSEDTPAYKFVRADPKQDDMDFACDLPELPFTEFP